MNPLRRAPEDPAFNAVALLIRLGLVIVGALIAIRLLYIVVGRIERAIRVEGRGTEGAREKRAKTIGGVLRGVSRGLIVVIAILMGARELGLDITPALAAAGGFGVAAGLGAQSVVRDWIAGFFFIRDNQFAVGDVIRVAGVSGTVETLTLRHTELRDSEGFIHFIPNGEIKVVTNLTKSWSTPIVRIPVSLAEDPRRVIAVIDAMLSTFRDDPKMRIDLIDGPRVLGIDEMTEGQFTLLIQAKTVPEQRLAVSRALRLAVLERLRAEGITVHTAAAPASAPAQAPNAAGTDGDEHASQTRASSRGGELV
jgi:small-conductance mechanosensitive channel